MEKVRINDKSVDRKKNKREKIAVIKNVMT